MTHQLDAFKQIISRLDPNVLKNINPHKGLSQHGICAKLEFKRLIAQAERAYSDFVTNGPISGWTTYLDALTELKNAIDEYFVWSICEPRQKPHYAHFDHVIEEEYTRFVKKIAELRSIYGMQPVAETNPIGVNPVEKKQDDSIASRVRARRGERR